MILHTLSMPVVLIIQDPKRMCYTILTLFHYLISDMIFRKKSYLI